MAAEATRELTLVARLRDLASREAKRLGTVIEAESRRIESAWTRASAGAHRFGEAVGKAGRFVKALVPGVGSIAATLGGLLGFGAAARAASEFGTAMAGVSTIVDEATVSLDGLRAGATEVAAAFGAREAEVARGLFEVLQSGAVDASDSIEFLRTAQALATAGVATTAESVDLLTTALSAYSLQASEAGRVSDVLFKAVELGKTTIPELAQGMGQVIPISAALGVNIEEVSAAIAALTLGGLRTDIAITGLRGALAQLLSPAEEGAKVLRRYRIDVSRSRIEADGFGAVLEEITRKLGGNEKALAAVFPEVRGLTAVLALAGEQADDFVRILDAAEASSGATGVALDKFLSEPAIKAQLALNRLRIVVRGLGDEVIGGFLAGVDESGGIDNLEGRLKILARTLGSVFSEGAITLGRLGAGIDSLIDKLGGPEQFVTTIVGGIKTAGAAIRTVLVGIGEVFIFVAEKLAGLFDKLDSIRLPDFLLTTTARIERTVEEGERRRLAITQEIEKLRRGELEKTAKEFQKSPALAARVGADAGQLTDLGPLAARRARLVEELQSVRISKLDFEDGKPGEKLRARLASIREEIAAVDERAEQLFQTIRSANDIDLEAARAELAGLVSGESVSNAGRFTKSLAELRTSLANLQGLGATVLSAPETPDLSSSGADAGAAAGRSFLSSYLGFVREAATSAAKELKAKTARLVREVTPRIAAQSQTVAVASIATTLGIGATQIEEQLFELFRKTEQAVWSERASFATEEARQFSEQIQNEIVRLSGTPEQLLGLEARTVRQQIPDVASSDTEQRELQRQFNDLLRVRVNLITDERQFATQKALLDLQKELNRGLAGELIGIRAATAERARALQLAADRGDIEKERLEELLRLTHQLGVEQERLARDQATRTRRDTLLQVTTELPVSPELRGSIEIEGLKATSAELVEQLRLAGALPEEIDAVRRAYDRLQSELDPARFQRLTGAIRGATDALREFADTARNTYTQAFEIVGGTLQATSDGFGRFFADVASGAASSSDALRQWGEDVFRTLAEASARAAATQVLGGIVGAVTGERPGDAEGAELLVAAQQASATLSVGVEQAAVSLRTAADFSGFAVADSGTAAGTAINTNAQTAATTLVLGGQQCGAAILLAAQQAAAALAAALPGVPVTAPAGVGATPGPAPTGPAPIIVPIPAAPAASPSGTAAADLEAGGEAAAAAMAEGGTQAGGALTTAGQAFSGALQGVLGQVLSSIIGGAFATGGIVQGGIGPRVPVRMFASGGVLGDPGFGQRTDFLPLKGYATGGPIVSKPHVALIGEGRLREAIVPLPDGKSIPVELRETGGDAGLVGAARALVGAARVLGAAGSRLQGPARASGVPSTGRRAPSLPRDFEAGASVASRGVSAVTTRAIGADTRRQPPPQAQIAATVAAILPALEARRGFAAAPEHVASALVHTRSPAPARASVLARPTEEPGRFGGRRETGISIPAAPFLSAFGRQNSAVPSFLRTSESKQLPDLSSTGRIRGAATTASSTQPTITVSPTIRIEIAVEGGKTARRGDRNERDSGNDVLSTLLDPRNLRKLEDAIAYSIQQGRNQALRQAVAEA